MLRTARRASVGESPPYAILFFPNEPHSGSVALAHRPAHGVRRRRIGGWQRNGRVPRPQFPRGPGHGYARAGRPDARPDRFEPAKHRVFSGGAVRRHKRLQHRRRGAARHPAVIRGASAGVEGEIQVADHSNSRIIRTDGMSGAGIWSFGTRGSGDGSFIWPRGVTVGSNGEFCVPDAGNDRIARMDDMEGTNFTSFRFGADCIGGILVRCPPSRRSSALSLRTVPEPSRGPTRTGVRCSRPEPTPPPPPGWPGTPHPPPPCGWASCG